METAPSFLPSFLSSLLPRNKQRYKTHRIPHTRVPQVGIRLHLAFLLWLFWALLAHQYSRCFALVLIPPLLVGDRNPLGQQPQKFSGSGKGRVTSLWKQSLLILPLPIQKLPPDLLHLFDGRPSLHPLYVVSVCSLWQCVLATLLWKRCSLLDRSVTLVSTFLSYD